MENIIPQIEKLIQLTIDGKIKWISPSANALRWVRPFENRSVTTTIQSALTVGAGAQQKRFILTISAPPEITIQINSQLQKDYSDLLEKLFNVALENSKGATGEFLDRFLRSV